MTVFDRAIIFAVAAHGGAFRKGSEVPYISHPLEVAAIAARLSDDKEVLAAAVLHDVLEDTPTAPERIEELFGKRVLALVKADSEDKLRDIPKSESWKTRKTALLEYLPEASRDEQIIVLADKLSNIRSVYDDYTKIGDRLWEKFNVKDKKMHAWYYYGVKRNLDKVKDTNAFEEFSELLYAVFGAEPA